ncbi:MAG TPA: hypothetical protein P5555_16870 [Candidatus Paceibacterota bacterium]|nr:hypothetical protein [Verrucomicrobiota bacterium]HOX03958.1 hypothetical protein [Verrucomicrobiota bacterium]HRZ46852.1 hypothetical protein [Candidatus Paceibacterota bacterium]HRZ93507.1 hypothetical protein [Candidatus Paceibacterota bacterium]
MIPKTFLLYGQPQPPADGIALRAGPLTMRLDPASGFVRRIMLGRREVLRGIYAAVRDHNWDTIPGAIREIARAVEPESFRWEFESVHRKGSIHFVWRGVLSGDATGTIRYTFEGQARSAFLKNRIGFCVLHPIRECAGAAARQMRVDGRTLEGRFPDRIEPQIFGRSSFRDLRGIAHEVENGIWAELDLDGDVFEMEDQRNWTDASFKTYCTPLSIPFPVEIQPGAAIRQSVTLRLTGRDGGGRAPRVEVAGEPPEPIALTWPEGAGGALPAIGLGAATHGRPLTAREAGLLRRLRPSHLRVDVRLGAPGWDETLEQAAADARQLGARLELALHLPRDGAGAPDGFERFLGLHAHELARVLALREGESATSPDTLRTVRRILGSVAAPVGAGSDCNFCELNRQQALGQLGLPGADFIFWSVNPQVHAFDHLSILETIEAQAATARSARAFSSGRPLAVSPVTLKQRFNPVATGAPALVPPGQLPPSVDARQLSLFAAAWTVGSLSALVREQVESLTYYETTGWRGVLESESGSPLPDQFPSAPGSVFPVYHVLAALAGCQRAAPLRASRPDCAAALAASGAEGADRLLIANLTSSAQTATLPHAPPGASARILHSETPAAVLADPDAFQSIAGERRTASDRPFELTLPPYAVALVDWGS